MSPRVGVLGRWKPRVLSSFWCHQTLGCIVALFLASCLAPECNDDCTNAVVWDAQLPATLTWNDVRSSTFSVCRNGSCIDGTLAAVREQEPLPGGSGVVYYSSTATASVTFSFTRTEGLYAMGVTYYEPTFVGGDHFAFEIDTPGGVVAVAETVEEFETVVPLDSSCETCLGARLGSGE